MSDEEMVSCPVCGPQDSEVSVIEFSDGYMYVCSECEWESWFTETDD